jgi:diaminohydroxyphosphoribosylaminopyrimidine deaminase/5-amino-6-(5-phosphoribosylamino)uracil reductase
MRRALDLAAQGDHRVGRNPRVGAVLVREGEVLAEGFHAESGGPHAEAAAFAAARTAGLDAHGATLYVTLEPCGSFAGKRTPACVEAVLASGVARVVVATPDPHPEIRGASLARLRAAGIEVEVGVEAEAAARLNGPYLKAQSGADLPFVTAKWAMSLDGKIASRTGHSQWISGAESRREVHRLRGEVDAILVGIGTALADDPQLTRREVPGGDPLRVVFDARAELPLDARLLQALHVAPLLLATTDAAPPERRAALVAAGAQVLVASADAAGRVQIREVLRHLRERHDVRHLLLEGGARVLASFFGAGLVDRVQCYVAPKIVGGHSAPGPVGGEGAERVDLGPTLGALRARPVGDDVLLEGHLRLYGLPT